MARELKKYEIVERSIIKKYRKPIWNQFIIALKEYKLVNSGDKVAVCISGGKDSMLLAKLMQELHRYSEVPFEVEYFVMDPGYNRENREKIESNAKLLNIPIKIFETDIFDATAKVKKSPCYLCARMRRGYLYKFAQDLGCNKIALGHHFNDVIETTLLGMFYGSQIQTMPPTLHSTNFKGMELIRPMYRIHEDSIIAWARYNELEFIRCACRFTENAENQTGDSKRLEIKNLIKELKKTNPNVEKNIFNSIHSVCLDTMVGYKSMGEKHTFLENYDKIDNSDTE